MIPVPHQLGGHCAVSALRDLVAWHYGPESVLADEDLLFMLAGGLDCLYWRRPGSDPPIYLLGRTGPLEEHLAAHLGLTLELVRPPSAGAAWAWLRATLANGHPALVLADVGALPYLQARTRFAGHRLLVIGLDESAGTVQVLDNDRAEVQTISRVAFEDSWGSSAFPEPVAYRYYTLRWPERLPPVAPILRAAIEATVRQLDGHGVPFVPAPLLAGAGVQGVAGVAALAADLARWAAGPPTPEATQVLRAIYLYVEKAGTGFGGFFRGLYGRGLRAAAALAKPDQRAGLLAAGESYIALGALWSAFAAACRAAAPAAEHTPKTILPPLVDQARALLAAEQAGRDHLAALLT